MEKTIREFFTQNWGLKLVSLVLALILWFSLIPEEKTFQDKTLTVPLEIHNIPSEMVMVERPRGGIEVTIRAPRRLIPELSGSNVYAILDLRNASVNQTQYSLNRNMVFTPVGAEVKEIYPSLVELKLEMTKEIALQIDAVTTGNLPEGYELVKVEVEPPTILVKGPESKINEDLKIQTRAVDITGYTESINVETELILPNPDLSFSSITNKVIVKLLIQEVKEEGEGSAQIKPPIKKKNYANE